MKAHRSQLPQIVFLLITILMTNSSLAEPKMTCTWVRRNGDSELVSSMKGLNNINDCINGLAITLLTTEPSRRPGVYDGTFSLKDKDYMPITLCDSRTLKPISDKDKSEVSKWLSLHRKGLSESKYLHLLLKNDWQTLIRSHLDIVDCMNLPVDLE